MPTQNGLKPGDRFNYEAGGKVLIIEPMPYGRLSKLLKLVLGSVDKISKMDSKDIMLKLPEIFDENLGQLISLMFDKKKHPFLNEEWVMDNITLVDMEIIINKGIVINGLEDFLAKMGVKAKPPIEEAKTAVAPTTSQAST